MNTLPLPHSFICKRDGKSHTLNAQRSSRPEHPCNQKAALSVSMQTFRNNATWVELRQSLLCGGGGSRGVAQTQTTRHEPIHESPDMLSSLINSQTMLLTSLPRCELSTYEKSPVYTCQDSPVSFHLLSKLRGYLIVFPVADPIPLYTSPYILDAI